MAVTCCWRHDRRCSLVVLCVGTHGFAKTRLSSDSHVKRGLPGSLSLAADDRSLEVHVCHSLTRELEVLQDHLLGLFADQSGLQPSHILVVTPDLEAAGPLIDAVFGTAPKERFIPYTVTGRSRSTVNGAAHALLALLSLAGSRFAASSLRS